MKKELIKNKLIKLIDTNDKQAIETIDIFLNEPYVDCGLMLNIINDYEDTFLNVLNSYEFINDEHKVFTISGLILHVMALMRNMK